jgi:transcriptional regulator with XRE-family HTH domain
MCLMKIEELGRRLRERRTAAGRTIASVAADAGLSVPYIANLENGRGNPTWSAVERLAEALGAELHVELATPKPPDLPESLREFAQTKRFRTETQGMDRTETLAAMAALAALVSNEPSELDWHRILDVIALMRRAGA